MLTDEILGEDIHKNCAFEKKNMESGTICVTGFVFE